MPENMSDRMPGMVPDRLSDIVMARVGFTVLTVFWSGAGSLRAARDVFACLEVGRRGERGDGGDAQIAPVVCMVGLQPVPRPMLHGQNAEHAATGLGR